MGEVGDAPPLVPARLPPMPTRWPCPTAFAAEQGTPKEGMIHVGVARDKKHIKGN